jgi:hypothetical protein
MSGRTFSGQDLAKALQAGEFEQPGLVLTGMIKPRSKKGTSRSRAAAATPGSTSRPR